MYGLEHEGKSTRGEVAIRLSGTDCPSDLKINGDKPSLASELRLAASAPLTKFLMVSLPGSCFPWVS
jgi:hypothetical protein